MPARTLPALLPHPLLTTLALLGAAVPAQGITVDWNPTASKVVLNTEVTTIQTSIGAVTVRGGVFVLRNVTIPRGTEVRAVGRNPLVFILAGTMRVDGTISVRGEDGESVQTLNSANFPARGGAGYCGAGDGGNGSPDPAKRSFVGGTGNGPLQLPGLGGGGGRINCANQACDIGSGGGGGCFATAGDPWYKAKPTALFVQPTGRGGYGCRSRTTTSLPGGAPGLVYFRDNDPSNDFFGVGFDVNRRRFILGELPLLVGGSGGGGGGDMSTSCAPNDPNFLRDEKGGGGGGGGGCLVIVAAGPIVLGATGRLNADGGHGGGGAWAGSSNKGGGGGGGAGGMVVLYTRHSIDITVHGETYANGDYDFAISADGGVSKLSPFGSSGGNVRGKYDPPPNAANLNVRPTGGFGGMGLIQLMAPPVHPTPDGTNTALDDNIILRDANGRMLRGAAKQRFLAWRGFPDAQGIPRDDGGNRVNIGDNDGEFRPSPVLLPVF